MWVRRRAKKKCAPKARIHGLVAPQETTRFETKGDVVFSTVFPKSFPKRNLRMCIPVTAFRRISSDYHCAIGRSARERNLTYAFASKSMKIPNRDSISVAEVVE